MPGFAAKGKSRCVDVAVGNQRDAGQQAVSYRLWGWKRFPLRAFLRQLESRRLTMQRSPTNLRRLEGAAHVCEMLKPWRRAASYRGLVCRQAPPRGRGGASSRYLKRGRHPKTPSADPSAYSSSGPRLTWSRAAVKRFIALPSRLGCSSAFGAAAMPARHRTTAHGSRRCRRRTALQSQWP
jgi:hypothetical protein